MKKCLLASILAIFHVVLPAAGDVIITEFMAANAKTLKTANGTKGLDWIELHNTGATDVDVSGWYLSDNPDEPADEWKKIKGSCVIPAGGFRIVWADKSFDGYADSEAYVKIGISSDPSEPDGDRLFLADPATNVVSGPVSYPAQYEDVSYSRVAGGDGWAYFRTPTPGAANTTAASAAATPAVIFSEPHGYRTAAFTVALACADGSTTPIYYTTDGSTPSATHGTRYTAPIPVSRTTCLRAVAPVDNALFENLSCATYLFVADIVDEPYSRTTVHNTTSPLETAQVLECGFNWTKVDKATVANALTNSLGVISLVTDEANLFDASRGIYVNANGSGKDWERPVSAELIDPTGVAGGEFTVPAGLRIRGSGSCAGDFPKHSFRLYFRSEYGASELEFPLFGDEGRKKFRKIDLRTSQNNSWSAGNSDWDTFVVETFSRDTQRDQGQPYTRSRYYHLYLNGHYWGLYQTQERADDDHAAAYLGGDASDWDVIKTAHASGGNWGDTPPEWGNRDGGGQVGYLWR